MMEMVKNKSYKEIVKEETEFFRNALEIKSQEIECCLTCKNHGIESYQTHTIYCKKIYEFNKNHPLNGKDNGNIKTICTDINIIKFFDKCKNGYEKYN